MIDGVPDDLAGLAGFEQWLRAQGIPEPNVEVYRRGAEVLASYATLDAALAAEEAAGASPRRLGNLRETDRQLSAWRASRPRPPATIDLAVAPAERPRRASVSLQLDPPRTGCLCKERQGVYLDDDWGLWGKAGGAVCGVGGIILSRFIGVLGAITFALFAAGMGGLGAASSLCFRCETCRRKVRDLDADERADVRRGRGKLVLVALGALAAAAVCAFIYYTIVKERLDDE